MENRHKPLEFKKIKNDAYLPKANESMQTMVSVDDPAIFVMTDFLHTTPICIESTATISVANERMIAYGIRLLFVSDYDNDISGLITFNDVWGERPINYIQEHGGERSDIMVLDIMTRKSELGSVKMSDVSLANVGDIVETIKACGRHHVLITEDRRNQTVVRGLFSISRISSLLRKNIELNNRANSFAELEKALTA